MGINIVKKGNDLTTPQVDPSWSVTENGYGLWTGRCLFHLDQSMGQTYAFTQRGQAFPISQFDFLRCHKFELKQKLGEIFALEAEYVGIAGGGDTLPNITGSGGLTTEHLTTHPNFFVQQSGFTAPICGVGSGTATAPVFAASTIKGGANQDVTLYEGFSGAMFYSPNGGQFAGFLDPEFRLFYGRTHYLARETAFAGEIYTDTTATVDAVRNALSCTSSTRTFAGVNLLPEYFSGSFAIDGRNQLLLSQVNFDDFAVSTGGTPFIYKITYEIRFNPEGYPTTVHKSA